MEYEKKYRPKWYQLMLLIIYSVAVVYTVLVNNPYLYSSKQYQEALAGKKDNSFEPIVTLKGQNQAASTTPQAPRRFDWNKDNTEDSGETRDRRYTEVTLTPLLMELDKKPESPRWLLLKDHIVLTTGDGFVYGLNYEGKTLWRFRSENTGDTAFLPEPTADENSLYAVNPEGFIYRLDLETGKLLWSRHFEGSLISDCFVFEDHLYLVKKTQSLKGKKNTPVTSAFLIKVERSTGKVVSQSDDLGIKAMTELSYDAKAKTLFLTSAEKLLVLEIPGMESKWQKSLSSEVIGPAVIVDNKALVSLKEGKVKIYNQHRGTEIHEVDLEHPIISAPGFIPIYNRAAITTADGYQHVIDLDGGKRLWRFDLNNKNNINDSWSARLSGNFIEELSMQWRYKGWTLWSPCVEKRICIYNPDKGQIVGRVMLGGQLTSLPRFLERSFHVIMEQDTGYSLGHYMERPAAKKISRKTDLEETSAN